MSTNITELWQRNPEQLKEKFIYQIIGFCGNGHLKDGGVTSSEFRDYLRHVPADLLGKYADQCLDEKFDNSGLALQDIVNEVGRRVGFEVANGRYRGTPGHVGNDGLWTSEEGQSIIVEVKTTDAYRIDLETIAGYRNQLIREGEVLEEKSTILVIVGREDTGGFEAQVRGSRHAWDVRLISVDALLRLMRLREEVEDPGIGRKIANILVPHEYTKVDGIIDVVFSAAEDVRQELEPPAEISEVGQNKGKPEVVRSPPVNFNAACVSRVSAHLGIPFQKRARTLYVSPDGKVSLTCAVSREHDPDTSPYYWFAFHPHQKVFLEATVTGYVSFGCGSEGRILLIPYSVFRDWIDGMYQTVMKDRSYWHIIINKGDEGGWWLYRNKSVAKIRLDEFELR
jgi:hypothetical protein